MQHLRTFTKGNLPFYLTTSLPHSFRNEYVILSQMKIKGKKFAHFLLMVCHKSFEDALRKKLDFDLMLDIEAKRVV